MTQHVPENISTYTKVDKYIDLKTSELYLDAPRKDAGRLFKFILINHICIALCHHIY